MGTKISRGIASTQFYFYGKKHFTLTGWENHRKQYIINEFESANMKGKNCLITGANSGIGFKIAEIYAEKGANVYMVCRDENRGKMALQKIQSDYPLAKLQLIIADVSLKKSIQNIFKNHATMNFDVVILNAGALNNTKTITEEGFEITFACQLAFGTYFMIKNLKNRMNPEGRIIVVSSGGMYCTPIPKWQTLIAKNPESKYDGQLQYAFMKRAQVILMEEFAKQRQDIKFLSCHPGWVDTPGVDSAYGKQKSYLSPMRNLYQGSEGIAWLGLAKFENLQNGAFYLDRLPQVKHMAGAFYSEGSFTKNSQEQIQEMIKNLEELCQ